MNFIFKKLFSIKRPNVCYYKILNVPITANQENIKIEYYKLAKKYHPDNKESSTVNQTEKFKEIVLAYEVLSDIDKRKEYDSMILGKGISKKTETNDPEYDYYRRNYKNDPYHSQKYQKEKSNIEKKAEEINKKLREGKSLDEVLENYSKHREKYKERTIERSAGFADLKYNYDIGHDPMNPYYTNKQYGDRYNLHNYEETVEGNIYWDTKENDEYYSKSKFQRFKLFLKEKLKK